MNVYGHKVRAILLLKHENFTSMINVFNNLDTHRSLVDNAELIDLGCKTIDPVPKNSKEYELDIQYNHKILIFKN